jgi:hypothetical protein
MEYIDCKYEFIENDTMPINFTNIGSDSIILKNNECINPFFVNCMNKSINNKDIYSNFSYVYILCTKDNIKYCEKMKHIYEPIINKNILQDIAQQCILIKAPLSLLKIAHYSSISCVITKEYLDMFEINDETQNEYIVIPFFELSESYIKKKLVLFSEKYNVQEMCDIINITSIYTRNTNKFILSKIMNYITSLQETSFWKNSYNCENLNMTNQFLNRKFIRKLIHDINFPYLNTQTVETTTPQTHIYNGIYSSIKSNPKRTYYYKNKIDVTIQTINAMFNSFSSNNTKELFTVFNTIATTKDYCHLVLNNKIILEKMAPLFHKYAPVYKYVLGYSWLSMIINEDIMKTKTVCTDSYVYDINTANLLPSFAFTSDNIRHNPYLSVLISQKELTNKISGINYQTSVDCYGVCNFNTFQKRLNYFISKNMTQNIFDGLNWTNYAISGSVIPACLQKQNPLSLTMQGNSLEDKWKQYIDIYYNKSDIDLICKSSSLNQYCDRVTEVYDILSANLASSEKIDITPTKIIIIYVTNSFFNFTNETFNDIYNKNYTSEEFKKNMNTDEVLEFVHAYHYVPYKQSLNKVLRKNVQYTKHLNLFTSLGTASNIKLILSNETYLYQKNEDENEDDINEIKYVYVNDLLQPSEHVATDNNVLLYKILESNRFQIILPGPINKTIELFKTGYKKQDFFSTVAKFHLPCVRAFYTGTDVYILPSCITAMMTGINIEYKYIAGTKDPTEIYVKYMQRGFGTILSSHEISYIQHYIKNKHKKSTIQYLFDNKNINDINDITGFHNINNKLFNNSKINNPINIPEYCNNIRTYYSVNYKYDPVAFGLDMFKFTTINELGTVNPFNSEVCNLFFDMMK